MTDIMTSSKSKKRKTSAAHNCQECIPGVQYGDTMPTMRMRKQRLELAVSPVCISTVAIDSVASCGAWHCQFPPQPAGRYR